MNNEQQAELERLERVLAVAKRNGNALFIQNIDGRSPPFSGENTPHSSRNTSQRKNGHQGASITRPRLETN